MDYQKGLALAVGRNYGLVLGTTAFGAAAFVFGQTAAFWQVERLTGSALQAGTTVASSWVLALLLGLWGGNLADRFDKRRLLIAANAAAALPGLALAATIAFGAVEWWMVPAFVMLRAGIRTVFESPARRTVVAELVDPSRLRSASSVGTFAESVGLGSGGALAGVSIAQVGVVGCLVIDAAACLVTAAALFAVARRRMVIDRPSKDRRDRWQGVRYIFAERALWGPLACFAPTAAVMLGVPALLPSLAIQTGSGVNAYGWLRGASSVGLMVGALVTALVTALVATERRPKNRLLAGAVRVIARLSSTNRLLAGAVLGIGTGAVMVGIPGTLVEDVIAIGVLTTAWGAFQAAVVARMVDAPKPELKGAIGGLYVTVMAASSICGAVVLGALADVWTARAVIGGCGALFIVAGIVAGSVGVRDSRRNRRLPR